LRWDRGYHLSRQEIEGKEELGKRTINCRLAPIPIITPAVTNNPPRFLVLQPLKISPAPRSTTPHRAVHLAPIALTILALTSAKKLIQLQVKLPTKLNVLGLESFSATRAAWMTPHEYVVPTNQKVRILQAKITTQP
jgi:hypothetical protein